MKKNIKELLLYGMIGYFSLVIILMIFNMFNMTKEISLNIKADNKTKFTELKERVNQLEESSCKNVLNDMVNTYETTNYYGTVSLNEVYDYYRNGQSFLQFYTQIKEKCNISDAAMEGYGLPNEMINSILYMEDIIPKYMFEYEINLKDNFIREIAESDSMNLKYNASKTSQLKIIEVLLYHVGGNNEKQQK